MTEEKNSLTLSDGKEIDFDFSHVTRREFRELFGRTQSEEEGDRTISKITGLSSEYLADILQLDWARIVQEILLRGNRPNPT